MMYNDVICLPWQTMAASLVETQGLYTNIYDGLKVRSNGVE